MPGGGGVSLCLAQAPAPSSLPWLSHYPLCTETQMENPDPVTAVCALHPGGCLS